MKGLITKKKFEEYIPENMQHLPIKKLLFGKDGINFNNNFGVQSSTGSGKSTILPVLEAQEFPEKKIFIREPSRVSAYSLYKGYLDLFSEYVTVGINTSSYKIDTDAQIVFVSDGILSFMFKRSLDDVIVYNDELHSMIAQTEIELAIQKREIERRGENGEPLSRLLTATIDPKQFIKYMNLDWYTSEGRTYNLNYKVVNKDLDSLIPLYLNELKRDKKSSIIFVPTRKMTEEMSLKYKGILDTNFVHAGEDPRKIEKIMREHKEQNKPIAVFSTVASATGVTVETDNVLIHDEKVYSSITKGIMKIGRKECDNNLILQMAGRAGRLRDGDVLINSKTIKEIKDIKPVKIELPLENQTPYDIALLMANYGITDIKELKLLSIIDDDELKFAMQDLKIKKLIEQKGKVIKLTELGVKVSMLPMDIPLGIILMRTPKELRPIMTACLCMGYGNLWGIIKSKRDSKGRYIKQPLNKIYRNNISEFISKGLIIQAAFKTRASGRNKLKELCNITDLDYKNIGFVINDFQRVEQRLGKMRQKLIDFDFNKENQMKIIDLIKKSKVFEQITFYNYNPNFDTYSTMHKGHFTVLSSESLGTLGLSGGGLESITALGKIIEVDNRAKTNTVRYLNCPTILNFKM